MERVEIYTKDYCGFCRSAKALLARKGVSYIERDIGQRPDLREEMVKRSGGRRTVPQIFIGGRHVGGSDDLHALERAGRLDVLLSA